jgi:hypothetical protein
MGKPSSIWGEEELSILHDNPGLSPQVLAEKLGRTVQSVAQKRHKLANPDYRVRSTVRLTAQDFDERPSGWYEESIGVMLAEYEPAFEAWRHYHRYVEIQRVSSRESVLGGVLHLMCRRDAEANWENCD